MAMLWLLVLIAVLGGVVNGKVLNDYVVIRKNGTGARFENGQLELELSDADPIASVNIGGVEQTIIALPPVFSFTATHVGSLTTKVLPYINKVRVVNTLIKDGNFIDNVTVTAPPTVVQNAAGRKLLGIFDVFAGIAKFGCGLIPPFSDICHSAGAAIAEATGSSTLEYWCKGNPDLLDKCPGSGFPDQELIDQLIAHSDFLRAQNAFNKNVTESFDKVYWSIEAGRVQTDNLVRANNETQRRQLATEKMVEVIAAQVDDNARLTRQVISELETQTMEQIAFTASVNSLELERFANLTKENILGILDVLYSDQDATVLNFKAMDQRVNEVLRLTKLLAVTVKNIEEERSIERALSSMVWESVAKALADGLVPFFLPGAEGQPPAKTISAAARTAEVERTFVNFITVGEEQTAIANTIRVNWWCDQDELQYPTSPQMDLQYFIETMAPDGCLAYAEATGQSIVQACTCWFSWQQDTCKPINGFSWETPVPDKTLFVDRGLQPTNCQPSTMITTGPKLIDSPAELFKLMTVMCRSNLPDLYPLFHIVSDAFSSEWTVKKTSPDFCNIDYNSLFVTGSFGPVVTQFMFNIWFNAWEVALTKNSDYDRYVTGVIPGYLNYGYIPFQADSTGEHFRANVITFAAMSPLQVPIFMLERESAEPLVTITTPEATTNFGGQPFIVSEASLPTNRMLVFGDISAGMGYVYDVPYDLMSLSPQPQAREAHVTYSMCPIPDDYDISTWVPTDPSSYLSMCDMAVWIAQNKYVFNHEMAVTSLHNYKIEVVNGQCVGTVLQTSGPICTLLKTWTIGSETSLKDGKLVVRPQFYSYPLLVVDIDAGVEVFETIHSLCPTVDYVGFTDRSGGQLTYTNPWQTDISFVAKRTSDSPQCTIMGDISYHFPRGRSYTVNVPVCHNYILQVFRQDAGGVLTSCGPVVNITLDPTSSINVDPASIGASNITTITDQNLEVLVSINYQAALASISNLVFATGDNMYTYQEYTRMNSTQLYEQLQRMRNLPTLNNITAITLEAGLADLRIELEAAKEAQAITNEELKRSAERQRELQLELARSINRTREAEAATSAKIDVLIDKNNALVDSLNRRIDSANTSNIIMWVFVGMLLACFCVVCMYFVVQRVGRSTGMGGPMDQVINKRSHDSDGI